MPKAKRRKTDEARMTKMPRRRFRFSLRTLLLAMFVLAVAFAWPGRILMRIRHQRQIVAQIAATGGYVNYDYQVAGKHLADKPPPGPFQLRYFLGDDAFAYVEVVSLLDSPTTGEVLKRLPELPRLTHVSLAGPQVDDSSVQMLQKLPGLRELSLKETNITSVGLANLRAMPELRALLLAGSTVNDETLRDIQSLSSVEQLQLILTDVTSDGLSHVGKLDRLRHLDILDNPKVDDKGLEQLALLPNLESLGLWRNNFTGKGIQYLRGLTHLKRLRLNVAGLDRSSMESISMLSELQLLDLAYTQVDDDGLEHVASLSQLQELNLTGTPVTDDGVGHLIRLKNLVRLELSGTLVTDEGLRQLTPLSRLKRLSVGPNVSKQAVQELSKSLPACAISSIPKAGPSYVIRGKDAK
jgi:internalin A